MYKQIQLYVSMFFFTTYVFKLIEKYEVDRKILKFAFIRYSPAETSTTNTPNNQT